MFRPFQAANRHSEASETSPGALAHLPPVQGLTFAVQVRSQIPVQIEDYFSYLRIGAGTRYPVLDIDFIFTAQDQDLIAKLYKTKIIPDSDESFVQVKYR